MEISVEQENSHRKSKERDQLQNILPEKVWSSILNQLTDPEDLENLSNSSPYLRDLLLPKRVLFLFPKVFEILASNTVNYDSSSLQNRKSLYNEARNQNENRILTATTFKCRQVCHNWRSAVDSFYQWHPSHRQTDQDDLYRWFHAMGHGTHTIFDSGQNATLHGRQFDSFLWHFENTHDSINPFISRSVSFEDNFELCSNIDHHTGPRMAVDKNEILITLKYWNGITEILTRYGHHLWYCDILLEDKMQSMYYLKLRQWLTLMPNLKILNIVYGQRASSTVGKNVQKIGTFYTSSEEELLLWEKQTDQHPLPTLEHLRFIKAHGLPAPIFNELITRNCHVTRIEFTPMFWGRLQQDYDIYSVRLPKLKVLSLKFGSQTELRDLDQGTWKLHTLDLRYVEPRRKWMNSVSGFVKWSWVFQMLSRNWSDTLTSLTLSLPPPETVKDQQIALREYANLVLDLRLLRRLKITLWDYLPIDFLLPLRFSLEYLQVTVDLRVQEDKNFEPTDYQKMAKAEKIRFLQTMPFRMNESNIWRFKKLQIMRVQHWGSKDGWRGKTSEMDNCWHLYGYLYTRREYERRMQLEKKMKVVDIQVAARKITLALVIFSLFALVIHSYLFTP